ncbi:2-(hydroxymethyl)glutarate dehydrogenase [Symbiodinium microadriaticum]|uniref:2-(Hydroxymethyl)glutarate dehydrogenase n=1 Tax=Symbiodinium microadriaticum TaxID=2951 RepID=A0A1Q9CEN2_SYMMI|nr:2-(hydroxymethyl)glutarate dehydrogenase [Symbiodinium microadriaticum]
MGSSEVAAPWSTSHGDTEEAVAERQAAQQLGQRGVGFLDAPVTGAPARAAAGTLTSMVGGSEKHLEAARPFLGTFATKILHMGEVGNGQLAKALNNCLYNVSCAAMAEMLPFALRAGLPMPAFVDAVTSGTGQSFGFNQWAPLVLRREFEAPKHGFPMGAAFKDLETLVAAASAQGLPVPPVVAATLATYQRALAMGLGEEHKGAMVKVWEAQMGVRCSGTEAEQKK